jgi:hypothetical protein
MVEASLVDTHALRRSVPTHRRAVKVSDQIAFDALRNSRRGVLVRIDSPASSYVEKILTNVVSFMADNQRHCPPETPSESRRPGCESPPAPERSVSVSAEVAADRGGYD